MKFVKKADGSNSIQMTHEEWQSLGKQGGWLNKSAMPVPISDEQRQQMADEGVFVTEDTFNRLPNTPKNKMKGVLENLKNNEASDFFINLDPESAVMLPAIYKPDPNYLVEIDGHNYYIINVTEPRTAGRKQTVKGIQYAKGDNIPGEIIAMDADNGLPVPMVFEQVVDKIRTPKERKEKILAEMNEEIEAWNKRVETIEKAAGPTKLALQLVWVEDKIKSRIEVLDAQAEAISKKQEANMDENHPGYDEWMQSLRDGIASGEFTLLDAFHSLLFLHQSNPEALFQGIQDGTIEVPEELRDGLLAVAAQELQLKGEKEAKDMQREREKEERIEEDLPAEREPVEEPLRPYTMDDIPDSSFETIQKNKTLGHWKAQMNRQLVSIAKNREALEEVLSSLEGLRGYIGALEKGQRSKEYLTSPEGQSVMNDIDEFLRASQGFIKGYSKPVIEENTINPSLLGNKGTIGNALVAVALNRIYSVIKRTFQDVMAEPVEEVPVEGSKQTKLEKMSELLWKSFEDTMRLK